MIFFSAYFQRLAQFCSNTLWRDSIIFDLAKEKAALAASLQIRNWEVLGGPPQDWDGIARKGELILVVDIDQTSRFLRRSGRGIRFPAIETYGPCTDCKGSGKVIEAAREIIISVDDEDFTLQEEKVLGAPCETCRGSGATWESRGQIIAEAWPSFQPNPKDCRWHLESHGQIIVSGKRIRARDILPHLHAQMRRAS